MNARPTPLNRTERVRWLMIGLLAWSFTIMAAPTQPPFRDMDPAQFSSIVTNPWLTLLPGTRFIYRSQDGGETEINIVEVTGKTRTVMGVATCVVWDRVWRSGRLVEETFDWFAQDEHGNVWYFGEDSRTIRNGKTINHAGSWEAGGNGATPGIIMEAQPVPGDAYRQELLKGIAEDMGSVVALHQAVSVPVGTFGDCLVTRDWTPLEPGMVEFKYYSRALGALVLEITPDGRHRTELISISRACDADQSLPPAVNLSNQ